MVFKTQQLQQAPFLTYKLQTNVLFAYSKVYVSRREKRIFCTLSASNEGSDNQQGIFPNDRTFRILITCNSLQLDVVYKEVLPLLQHTIIFFLNGLYYHCKYMEYMLVASLRDFVQTRFCCQIARLHIMVIMHYLVKKYLNPV